MVATLQQEKTEKLAASAMHRLQQVSNAIHPQQTSSSMQASWRLDGQRVCVTGSTKGIGRAVAVQCLEFGASVVITARTESDVQAAVAELGALYDPARVSGLACDLSGPEGRAALAERLASEGGGKLDVLVNNVGTNVRQPIEQQSEEEYHNMMRTNVDSCYFLAKALGPLLKAAGATAGGPAARIVNVASVAGVTSSGTGIVYGMSKAAMVQMSRGLACEWAKHNVRVNTVAPWMTMTPLLEEALKANPNQLEKVGEMKHSSTTLSNSFPLYLSASLPLCPSASLPLCPIPLSLYDYSPSPSSLSFPVCCIGV